MINSLKKILGLKIYNALKFPFRSKSDKQIIINTKKIIQGRRKFYSQFFSSKSDIYFDVGANYGNRIEPLINTGIKIVAIEPQIECVRHLKNKYKNKIDIIQKGLGEKEEVKTMYISNSSVLSSFSKDWINSTKQSGRFKDYNWNLERQIEITTLDNLIDKYGKPKFIKIDVEGFEYEVLKGLSHPIEYLSFEYAVPEKTNGLLECIDRLTEISKDHQMLFNYSIGESLTFASENWFKLEEIKGIIQGDEFNKTDFGDIYAKTIF